MSAWWFDRDIFRDGLTGVASGWKLA